MTCCVGVGTDNKIAKYGLKIKTRIIIVRPFELRDILLKFLNLLEKSGYPETSRIFRNFREVLIILKIWDVSGYPDFSRRFRNFGEISLNSKSLRRFRNFGEISLNSKGPSKFQKIGEISEFSRSFQILWKKL